MTKNRVANDTFAATFHTKKPQINKEVSISILLKSSPVITTGTAIESKSKSKMITLRRTKVRQILVTDK